MRGGLGGREKSWKGWGGWCLLGVRSDTQLIFAYERVYEDKHGAEKDIELQTFEISWRSRCIVI